MGLVNKFLIEDWQRKPFGYRTCFEGEEYHLLQNPYDSTLEIQKNEVPINLDAKVPNLRKLKARQSLATPSCCDSNHSVTKPPKRAPSV